MKLLVPSVPSFDMVEIPVFRSFNLRDLGRAIIGRYDLKDRVIDKQTCAGRTQYSNCTIDFEGSEPPLFTDPTKPYKRVTLDFGEFQYHGVVVAEYTESPTVFICSIDHITYKDNP